MSFQCRECSRSKFDSSGACTNCGTVSWEYQDYLKNQDFEKYKKLNRKDNAKN